MHQIWGNPADAGREKPQMNFALESTLQGALSKVTGLNTYFFFQSPIYFMPELSYESAFESCTSSAPNCPQFKFWFTEIWKQRIYKLFLEVSTHLFHHLIS